MTEKQSVKNQMKKAMAQAKASRKLMIIEMPEEIGETTVHWLVWLALLSFIGLASSLIWQFGQVNNSVQAFLPFL